MDGSAERLEKSRLLMAPAARCQLPATSGLMWEKQPSYLYESLFLGLCYLWQKAVFFYNKTNRKTSSVREALLTDLETVEVFCQPKSDMKDILGERYML